MNRLKQLKEVENLNVLSITKPSVLVEVSEKYMPVNPNSDNFKDANPQKYVEEVKKRFNQRYKDYISHFILRLAYCQTEDLREWFIKQETSLLKIRWSNPSLSKEEKIKFIESLNLNIQEISNKEKMEVEAELQSVIQKKINQQLQSELLHSSQDPYKRNQIGNIVDEIQKHFSSRFYKVNYTHLI